MPQGKPSPSHREPVDSYLCLPAITLTAHASNENIIISASIQEVSLPTVQIPDPAQFAEPQSTVKATTLTEGDGSGSLDTKGRLF